MKGKIWPDHWNPEMASKVELWQPMLWDIKIITA